MESKFSVNKGGISRGLGKKMTGRKGYGSTEPEDVVLEEPGVYLMLEKEWSRRGRKDEKNVWPVSDPDVRTSSSHQRGLSGKQQPRESGGGGPSLS